MGSSYEELDRLTLERCQRGERDACRTLVRVYQHAVYATLQRMLAWRRSRAVVDELAQETFLRVFKALSGFDPNGPARLSTWILTVASRLAIDELRKPIVLEPLSLAADAVDETLHTTTEQRALAEQISRAVSELPPDFRETFVLSVFHECSHEEIAHALHVEIGTVKSRLSRAKQQVRDKLGASDD